jgi:uncharacterized protein
MITVDDVKAYYSADDPVHGFSHIKRVLHLCREIGEKEGADWEILQAAALLHDLEGDVDSREGHQLAAADRAEEILARDGWQKESIKAVKHCIRAHRFRDQREKPETIEARVLFDADKLDAIGAVGIARAFGYAVRAEQDLYQLPSEKFLKCWELESSEAHTPYHEYLFKLKKIQSRLFTKTAIKISQDRQRIMELFFDQWVRELEADKPGEDD